MSTFQETQEAIAKLLEEVLNGAVALSMQKGIDQTIVKNVYERVKEDLSKDTKIKVIPATVRGSNQLKTSSKKAKPTAKHNWIHYDDAMDYTTDFTLSSGYPLKYKNVPYIPGTINDTTMSPITSADIPKILLMGYKPYQT